MNPGLYKSPALAILFIIIFLRSSCVSQPLTPVSNNDTLYNLREEIRFIHYCEGRHNLKDAVYLLNQMRSLQGLPMSLKDSVHYMLGWDHYSLKNLDTSSFYFFKVSEHSNFYLKSRCFGYYNRLYQGHKSEAKEGFASLHVPALQEDSLGPVMRQLIALELAGIALLERSDQDFNIQSSQFNYEFYPVATEQKNLLKYQTLLREFKPKSPGLAALMSAILPGSGKIYAGKTGEGVAAFLVVASLGLVGWENFHKDGLTDWKTLLAGGIFTLYYSGNILGSAKAAQRHNHEFNQALDNRILFDLHIPLRNIFN